MIKKVSNGGDSLIGRVHRDNEIEFVPHFLSIAFANDISKISGIDNDTAINNRLKLISYTERYVEEPSNEFKLKIDHNIDNEMKTKEFKEAFNFIIFAAYLNYINNGNKTLNLKQ